MTIDYDTLLDGPKPNATPASAPDKYDALMDGYDALRKQRVAASTTLAVDTPPDQYAAARKAAQQMGYPVAVAEALPAEVQREARIRTVQTDAAASPTLQRKYTDADFARLAHDDSGVLSSLAAAARYITSADDKRGLTNDIAAGYYQAQAGAAGALRAVTDIAAYPFDFLEGVTAIGGNPLRRLAEGWGMIAQANMADQQRSASQFDGNFGQGVSSGIQSLTGNALTLPLALLPGGQPAALTAMSAQAGGQSYQNAREKGVGQVQSLVYGLSDAVIEYGTEKIPLSRLIEGVKAGAGPLATFVKTSAAEVPGEQIATALQDLNEWAVMHPDKPFSAYLADRPDAAAQTLIATLIGTGGNVTITHAMQRVADNAMDIQRGENAGLGLQQMLALAAQSKLRERSPDQFADMVNGMAQDANAPSELRFDARTLAEALSQSGLDINQVLPSAAAQLEEAVATGGEITVPIGEYAANIVGTDAEKVLTEHARIGDNELSQFEAKEAAKQAEEFLQQQAQRVIEQGLEAGAQQSGADVIKQTMLEQLNAAGRFTPQVNDAYATLVGSYYANMAQRLGVTAEQLYARYPLKVEGAQQGGEQLDSVNQSEPVARSTYTDRDGTAFDITVSRQTFGAGSTAPNAILVEVRDPATGERRAFTDFSLREDGVLTSENTRVAPSFQKRGLAAAMYSAARQAGFDIAPGRVQTDQGLAMVDSLHRQGIINREAVGPRFRTGDLSLAQSPRSEVVEQGPRAQYTPDTLTISLLERADLSSFLHELGHAFLEFQTEIASQPGAPQQIVDDVNTVLKWFGSGVKPDRVSLTSNPVSVVTKKGSSSADVAATLAKLPPVPAGHTRLFRASSPTVKFSDVFDASQLKGNATDRPGEFFTDDLGYADYYRTSYGRDASIEYVDLPTAQAQAAHLGGNEYVVERQRERSAIEVWRSRSLEERRADHEKFAESFEEYLLEGKAPSTELQPLFTRFRSWLTNVYRSLSNFLALHGGSQLSPEVRGVFDRIIASEDEIRRAEEARTYAPLFKSAAQAGMSPQEWASYQASGAKATEAALANLESRSIKDMRWLTGARSRALKALQKDAAAKRKAIETEVENEVAAQPTYQAIRWLKTGRMVTETGEEIRADKGFRISTEALAEMYPESALGNPDLEKLKGMTAKNGMHPDLIAPLFGFESGDQLVRTVADAEPMASVIEGMTDQRVLERYGELGAEAGLQRAADEAVHNEARGRFIATELKALAEAGNARERTQRGGSINVMVRAAKDFANQLIARQKVRDVSPGKYTRAESRAGRLAEAALRKGETEEAITAQRDKLLNHYAAREALRTQEEIERAVAYLKKFDKESVRSKLPVEYVDQIDKLLERVDLRQVSNREADKRAKLAAWIKSQEDLGIEPDIPDSLLEDSQLQPYREMSVEQFRGLVDAVKQIEHLGRVKEKLLTAKDQREFSAIVDDLKTSVLANAGGRRADTRTPTTNLGRALQGIRNFGAAHIKAATWARVFDGGKDGGVFWERFIRPANERADQEAAMRAKATKALTEIMAPVLKQKLGGSGTYFDSIGRSLNKEGVLALALNTGNDSNLQRLLGGEGWTMDQIQPVLESMTADDWKTVQAIWDYFESYRPEIGAMERRVRGTEPAWVEPTERTVQTADGQTVTVRGGYYPVKYDPSASIRAEEHADAEAAKRQLQNAYSAATVRRGFTKGRAEEVTGRPLLYSLKGVYDGINDVIHYLAWQEWLIDVNRLLRNQSIDTAIRSTYGPAAVKQLRTWRDAVAEGESGSQEALDMALGKLRQSVSVAGLGFNVVSALMQPLGLTQSMVRVGTGWIGKGVAQYAAAPVARTKEVNEKSSFMANRARTRFRELNELRNKVQGQAKYQEYVGRYAYWLMMRFQQAVDVPTWLGAYEKAIADGNDEARSIALADQAVKDAQGGGQTLDLSAIERGGPAQKLFTVFYSFMNTALNLGVASKMTPTSKAKFAADMLLLYTVPAVLGSLLKDALTPGDAGDDDPDKLLKKLAGEQLSFLLGLVVVGREFGELGKTLVGANDRPRDYAGPAGVRAIVDAYQFGKQVKQGEFDDAFRKALINLSGDLFGLPSAQINRTITGAKALAEGETENPAALLTGFQKPK